MYENHFEIPKFFYTFKMNNNYEFLSGVVEYSVFKGKLDDNVERTIYMFADVHTTYGECDLHRDVLLEDLYYSGESYDDPDEIWPYEYLDFYDDSLRITGYIFDSFEYAKDKDFTIDYYSEIGRYIPSYEIKNTGSHIEFYKLANTSSVDIDERLNDFQCGQYERMKNTDECLYENLRYHFSDERDQFIRKFENKKDIDINELKNDKLFLSPEWYIDYMFKIIPQKLVKQWDKIESNYLSKNKESIFENIMKYNYDKNLKSLMYSNVDNILYKLSIYDKGTTDKQNIPKFINNNEGVKEFMIFMLNPIMELYTLGRMFKKFDNEKYDKQYAKNIIVYVGKNHYDVIINFLEEYGFKQTIKSDEMEYYEEDDLYNQCIKIKNLPYPAFSDKYN